MVSAKARRVLLAFAVLLPAIACESDDSDSGGPAGPPPYLEGHLIYAWGSNASGQLGDGTKSRRTSPVPAEDVRDIRALAAASSYSLALKIDGTVWRWGDGSTLAEEIEGLTDIVSIGAGETHSIALTSSGQVVAWGSNTYGQLGDGTDSDSDSPIPVKGLNNVVSIAAGRNHSLAIRSDLTLWSWGRNDHGQLGDGTTTNRNVPTQVGNLRVLQATGAGDHVVALTTDLHLAGWGNNSNCQLGAIPSSDNTPCKPVQSLPHEILNDVAVDFDWPAIAASQSHTLLRLSHSGDVAILGDSAGGPLPYCGDGAPPIFSRLMDHELTPTRLVSGVSHSLIATSDGRVFSFGKNSSGQLGHGTISGAECLEEVKGIRGANLLAAGGNHSLATVMGIATPSIPGPLTFPNVDVGKERTVDIRVSNDGLVDLKLYQIKVDARDEFAVSQTCALKVLKPGESCKIEVTFEPAAAGERNTSLTIEHDGLNERLVVPIRAAAKLPDLEFDPRSQLSFTEQRPETVSPPKSVGLFNRTDSEITIDSITASGEFAIALNACNHPLAPDKGCVIGVSYSPIENGVDVGSIQVVYNGAQTATFLLQGTANGPAGRLSGIATFPDTQVGDISPSQRFFVQTTGSLPLSITQVNLTGDFRVDTEDCTDNVLTEENQSCVIDVIFVPNTPGLQSARLTVDTDASTHPYVMDIVGSGT